MANPLRQTTTPQPAWVRLCQWLWKQRGFVWGTVIVGIALNIFASWLITPSGAIFSQTPLGTILGHPLFLALGGLGLLGLTGGLWIVNRLNPASVSQKTSTRPLTQKDQQAVLRLFHQEYSKRLAQSLQGVVMMVLGLQERIDVIRSSAQLVFRRTDIVPETPLPPGTTILQAYDNAGQGLLILGAPGAGKTTLLLELAQELLTRAQNDPQHPIPVILNLSSWTSKKVPLASWLVNQLRMVYGVPPRLGQTLLEQDHWLLLLDGLDEVKASARSQCIEAINLYREEHFAPLVVCSRRDEYAMQHAQLALSSAVEIQPLQEQEVMTYLKGIGKPMATVRAALRSNPVLKQLLTTPRWLSLMILTYRDKAIRDLPQLGTAEQQKQHILERYVERMLEQPTTKGHSMSKQTRRWLIWLAQQMQQLSQTEFFLEQMQPSWLPSIQTRRRYRVVVVLVVVLLSVLVGGLGGVLFSMGCRLYGKPQGGEQFMTCGGLDDLFSYLLTGLLMGLFIGLVEGLLLAQGKYHLAKGLKETGGEIQFVELTWQRHIVLVSLISGLIIALVALTLMIIAAGMPSFELTLRCIILSILAGISFGAILGLRGGGVSGKRLEKHDLTTPNQGLQHSAQSGALCMLSVALFGALGDGLYVGSLYNLIAGFGFGLIWGLLFGWTFGGSACIQHFVLRWILKQEGSLPWHYVRFLEEVTEHALLQRIGGGYSFIPPLQDYFASFGTEISAGTQSHLSSLQP